MKEKILIVENDEIVKNNLNDLLTAEGYNCKACSNGLEALKLLSRFHPHLIISDTSMPFIDGFELMEKIQNTPALKKTPFIIISAKADSDSIRKGMAFGADDYLTKPFTADDLLSTVKTRLKKRKNIEDQLEEYKLSIIKYVPHELRTPLVAILGYSDLLLEEMESAKPEEVKQMISEIKKSGIRLSDRIEKFLIYSELTTQLQDQTLVDKEMASCSVDNATIEKIINNEQECFDRLSDFDYTFETESLSIDEKSLDFLLAEVIQNACKFSNPGDPIKVYGFSKKDFYQITISDTGRGMTEDEQKSISAFKQFNRDQYQQAGNGLGLSIVDKILKLSKGKIKIESKKNSHTKISISIPIHFNNWSGKIKYFNQASEYSTYNNI